jgi:hypothetical protein
MIRFLKNYACIYESSVDYEPRKDEPFVYTMVDFDNLLLWVSYVSVL